MKKTFTISLGVLVIIFIFFTVFYTQIPYVLKASPYSPKEIERIENLFPTTKVCGIINKDCSLYSSYESMLPCGSLKKDCTVEVLSDRSYEWYCIRESDNSKEYWVSSEDINIEADPKTLTTSVSKKDIEDFSNLLNLESSTNYLLWTCIDRQETYVFTGKKGKWRLKRTITCATGKNISPTTKGTFEISERGEWFYTDRLKSGAKYWMRFNNSYLYHSLAMDENKTVIDDTLGERCSSGCIRMSLEDIEWLFNEIPSSTTVFVQ